MNSLARELGIGAGQMPSIPATIRYAADPRAALLEQRQVVQRARYHRDPARAEQYAYLTEGIKSDREKLYGPQSSSHTEQVVAISEMLFEQTQAFNRDGVQKSAIDIVNEWNQQDMIRRFSESNGYTGQDTLRILEDVHGPLAGDASAITAGAWTTLALGLVRRIYPKLLAFELFQVQPMRLPTWKIFFQEFQRGDGAGDGTRLDVLADFDSDYANRSTEASEPVRIDMDITSADVTAVAKALKSVISEEAIQDIKAYWDLDASQELLAKMQDEILREIDYQLLTAAYNGATAGDVVWDPNPPSGSDVVNSREHRKTLYEAIIDAKSAIGNKIHRSPTWMIGSIDDVARLEKLEEFKIASSNFGEFSTQRHFKGTLQDQLKVYADPWWPHTGEFLVGYKGSRLTETGLVYAPYIPLYVGPELHESNFTRTRSVMSRYAKHVVNGNCYARVQIQSS